MEAMAAGVPVVATAAGGTEELIADGASGLIVPVGDEAALAEAASKVLSDPRLAGQLAEAASAEVRRRFTVEAMARAYGELLENLLGRKGKDACIPGADGKWTDEDASD
jgi:glycosyltransferase involved in cell wall biosynthesis